MMTSQQKTWDERRQRCEVQHIKRFNTSSFVREVVGGMHLKLSISYMCMYVKMLQ